MVIDPITLTSFYVTVKAEGTAKTVKLRKEPSGSPASRTWFVSHVLRIGRQI